jgi:hypothetical protein
MKALGITAVILTVLSFLFWLVSWSYWTFASFAVGYDGPIRYVIQGISTAGVLTEYLAILIIGIGLIAASKRWKN